METQLSGFKVLFCDPYGSFMTWTDQVSKAGGHWDLVRVDNFNSALESLKVNRYDAVVVATLSTPERELAFLRVLMGTAPDCARILYAPVLTPNLLSRALEIAHRVCLNTDPVDLLVQQIDQSIASNSMIFDTKVRRSLASFKQLPSPPSVYQELTRLLNSEQTTSSHISTVVSKDPALAARVLRLVNSSYFGLATSVSSIQQAVTLIGVRTLRALALAGHFGRHYKSVNWDGFDLNALQTRALMVARLAQQLSRTVSRDPLLRDQAFLSGLLLDVGMLMLVCEQSRGYQKVLNYSAKHQIDLAEVETRGFGVSHAQLGAGLLSQWNLPPLVVDAVLYHHNPGQYHQKGLSPVALAHVADALLPPLVSDKGQVLSATLDVEFLKDNALDEYLPKWKMEANGFRLQSKRAAS